MIAETYKLEIKLYLQEILSQRISGRTLYFPDTLYIVCTDKRLLTKIVVKKIW